jgi:hypothetical protein
MKALFSLRAAAALATLTLPCLAQPCLAQTAPSERDGPLSVSGSIRMRYEVVDGQARAGFNDRSDLLNVRTRLAAEYKADRWRIFGEIYDSRAYLGESGDPVTTNEVNALEIIQGYVAWKPPVALGAAKSELTAGRFSLNLGSRRLVAADDYRNTTSSYTGLRYDAEWAGGASASAIYVLPQIRLPLDSDGVFDNAVEFDRESFDLQLFGGLLTVPFGPERAAVQPSYFGLRETAQPDIRTRGRDLDSFGLRFFRDPAAGQVDFDIEAIAQRGTISIGNGAAAPRQDVEASYLHVEAGKSWGGWGKPRLAFEFDHASGDEPGGANNRFDTLFGMRRGELAPAGLYNAIGRTNLTAPGLRLELTPSPRWDMFLGLKGLWLASETDAFSTTGVRDPSGESGRHAGNQLDVRLRRWLAPQRLRAEVNFVYLDKGRFLKTAPNASDPRDTVYVAVDFTTFF